MTSSLLIHDVMSVSLEAPVRLATIAGLDGSQTPVWSTVLRIYTTDEAVTEVTLFSRTPIEIGKLADTDKAEAKK